MSNYARAVTRCRFSWRQDTLDGNARAVTRCRFSWLQRTAIELEVLKLDPVYG